MRVVTGSAGAAVALHTVHTRLAGAGGRARWLLDGRRAAGGGQSRRDEQQRSTSGRSHGMRAGGGRDRGGSRHGPVHAGGAGSGRAGGSFRFQPAVEREQPMCAGVQARRRPFSAAAILDPGGCSPASHASADTRDALPASRRPLAEGR